MGKKYTFSFTAGNLFMGTAPSIATLYLSTRDWDQVRSQMLEQNLLQARAHASLLRLTNELLARLKVLTPCELELLSSGSIKEQRQVLWLAAAKQYLFVREFATEVLRDKYLRYSRQLNHQDFDIFFNNKAEWEEHLNSLTILTKEKIRQVLFQMMVDAELVSPDWEILPTLLSPEVANCLKEDDPSFFQVFNLFDRDIDRYIV